MPEPLTQQPASTPVAGPSLARGASPAAPAARAARDFEAQVLGVLLQTMFQGLGQGGALGGGAAEAQWRPMLVEEYARSLARAGGIGLADTVLREMQRLQEGGRE